MDVHNGTHFFNLIPILQLDPTMTIYEEQEDMIKPVLVVFIILYPCHWLYIKLRITNPALAQILMDFKGNSGPLVLR